MKLTETESSFTGLKNKLGLSPQQSLKVQTPKPPLKTGSQLPAVGIPVVQGRPSQGGTTGAPTHSPSP